MKSLIRILIYLFLYLPSGNVLSQIQFTQQLDSTFMLIGDQQNLSLYSSAPKPGEQIFMILDTLSWMHILDRGSWNVNDKGYVRKILFTVFDSGYYEIPGLGIIYENDSFTIQGNPLYLSVNNPTDSLNVLRPIKHIEETQQDIRIIFFVIAGLFILGMVLILWLFFKADRVRHIPLHVNEQKSFWQISLEALHDLKQKKLLEAGQIKTYYDELNFILRNFLSNGLKIPALENTSSEIIEQINAQEIELKNTDELRACFTDSDLVKFANAKPSDEKSRHWMYFAEEFIKDHKDISEGIIEKYRVHWHALLGQQISSQFEFPFETVPKELQNIYQRDTEQIILIHKLVHKLEFDLPKAWVALHEMKTGSLYNWHLNILNISRHKFLQILLLSFVLPFLILFIPILILQSFWTKSKIFSRGIFGLSRNNKLIYKPGR